jgi:hypothetical protein
MRGRGQFVVRFAVAVLVAAALLVLPFSDHVSSQDGEDLPQEIFVTSVAGGILDELDWSGDPACNLVIDDAPQGGTHSGAWSWVRIDNEDGPEFATYSLAGFVAPSARGYNTGGYFARGYDSSGTHRFTAAGDLSPSAPDPTVGRSWGAAVPLPQSLASEATKVDLYACLTNDAGAPALPDSWTGSLEGGTLSRTVGHEAAWVQSGGNTSMAILKQPLTGGYVAVGAYANGNGAIPSSGDAKYLYNPSAPGRKPHWYWLTDLPAAVPDGVTRTSGAATAIYDHPTRTDRKIVTIETVHAAQDYNFVARVSIPGPGAANIPVPKVARALDIVHFNVITPDLPDTVRPGQIAVEVVSGTGTLPEWGRLTPLTGTWVWYASAAEMRFVQGVANFTNAAVDLPARLSLDSVFFNADGIQAGYASAPLGPGQMRPGDFRWDLATGGEVTYYDARHGDSFPRAWRDSIGGSGFDPAAAWRVLQKRLETDVDLFVAPN